MASDPKAAPKTAKTLFSMSIMPTTSSCLSYKPDVADSISFRWPCKLIANLLYLKYLTQILLDTIISHPTLARGVVVRPIDDASPVEVAAVPRPESVVLRALRKAVTYDLRRRCARLGKKTRARKLSPHVRARELRTAGFARNPGLFFSLALFS